MTGFIPPMLSLSGLVGAVVQAASRHICEGSRGNARAACRVRPDAARPGRGVRVAVRAGRSPVRPLS